MPEPPVSSANVWARGIFIGSTPLWWVLLALLIKAEGGIEKVPSVYVILGAVGPSVAVYILYSGIAALRRHGVLTARRTGFIAATIASAMILVLLFQAFGRYETVRMSADVFVQRDRITNDFRICNVTKGCSGWRH